MKANKEEIVIFLKEIKCDLLQKGIGTVGLFGSFAREEAGVYSDIDIAIEKEKHYLLEHSAYDYFNTVSELKETIRKRFQRNSDVFDLDSDSCMRETILKDIVYV